MLELDPRSVKEKQDAYTSLTDLYGVDVFTDRFIEAVKAEQKHKEQTDTELISNIFTYSFAEEDVTDRGVIDLLFQEKTSEILFKEYNKTQQQISPFHVCMVLIAMLAVLMVYRIFWQGKRGGKTEDDVESDIGFSK